MPIHYHIDHDRRLVLAEGSGVLSDADVFGYQKEVWSRADVAGYNELVDVTAVEKFAVPSGQRVVDLAVLSAAMDTPAARARFAIVAPQDIGFGLGRMFEITRNLEPRSTKQVAVFRTRGEALAFLEIEDEPRTDAVKDSKKPGQDGQEKQEK
jgi:hypothetical protein